METMGLNADLADLGLNEDPLHNEEVASSQPTEDGGQDSDAMLDPPMQNVGDVQEITYDSKVKKEILEVGDGVKKPKMNYLVNIIYTAYFFDHTIFDSSDGKLFQISLGDISWPEGLWKAIQEMRQGEKAKIKIKRKYGFGRKENVDKLNFPKGYEEGENRERLMKKGIIYEVKLVDWIERIDLEADGNFLKTFVQKPPNKEWERPTEIDEVNFSLKAYFNPEEVLYQREKQQTKLNDPEISITFRKILESLKRNEHSKVEVKRSFITEQDPQLLEILGDKLNSNPSQNLTVEAQLHDFVKVEDWFKDNGSCLKRILRKGKGSNPNSDSTIKIRLKITVNDVVVLNNWSTEGNPKELYDLNIAQTPEEKEQIQNDPSLYSFTLDRYNLPSILIKVLKSMRKNEVCEFIANSHYDKLRSNLPNDLFDQYKLFKEGDKISFLICLLDQDKDVYFYQMKAQGKLDRVQTLKNIAGQFFKLENYKKAARIYQKINGYYNFGDVANNHAKEDEETEEFKKTHEELRLLKITSFMNLVVCKYKMKEFSSIVGITDQVIELDPKNIKCLYFRGKAYLELQEYDSAVQCYKKLVEIDPTHADGRKEYERAKQLKKKFLEDQHKKYSKFFS